MKNVVLLGFQGTGKSVIARRLSKVMGREFVDIDRCIEQKAGKTVAEIFAQDGEAAFRTMESHMVDELSQTQGRILSTGGGIVLNPRHVERLRQNGILVLLEARPEIILSRVRRRIAQRPLLQGSNPLQTIERLLKERVPYYRCADFTVDTSELSVREVAHRIQKRVLQIEHAQNLP